MNLLIDKKIDFIKSYKLLVPIIVFLLISSIAFISLKGLNLGIDFSGGTLIEAKLNEKVDLSKVRSLLNLKNMGKINIQNFDNDNIMIKTVNNDNSEDNLKIIKEILNNNYPNIEYRKVDFVGPQIGSELIKKGILAILFSFISIMIYIWFRFDWQFGVGAIIAIIHDVILTFGFLSITSLEFNLTSIAALLTIIGYSINDTVVIYDRIRENLIKYKKMELSKILNISLNSTLNRTLITSGITLISIFALVIFGGEVLRSFSLAIFFGIFIGTFSSIYISAPILLYFDPRKNKDEN